VQFIHFSQFCYLRTGSGKSSLVQALFRILEAEEGSIEVGGVDISLLGLHTLRTSMAVIPQSPVLFSGCTVRENLDPFGKCDEANIRHALGAVQMSGAIDDLPHGLDTLVAERGSNFSVGQRQLLCLARAILLKKRILVLDEPTANVDTNTDQLLQHTLKENFSEATIISVAHRLDTIIDYDRILVLGEGRVLEYGSPSELLSKEEGHFASMVRSTGESMAEILHEKARLAK
jgi:ATP-binding cassette subfamily C (CFTR/MRP) protein 4